MNILFQRIKNKAEDLFGVDLRSLALFRICIALLIIVDLLQRISDFSAFYTTSGILPIQLIEKVYHHGDKYISVHMLNDSFKFQLTLFIIALFSSVALLIGVFTRFFTIILWFLTLSLHVRSPWYQIGGDELIRMMLFWSIFLPLNARFSIDTKFFNSFSGTRILSISSLAILLQVVLIYWVSFIAKIKSADWINGDAIYYVLSNENQATSFGQYLFQHHNLLKFLTYATLVFEVLGPLLLFSPFFTSTIRTLMIITFVFFHICIGSCLELTIFPWVSSISMIPFLPSKIWNIFPRRSGLANVYGSTIYSPISINLLASCFLLLLLSWNSSIIKPEFKLDRKVIYLAKILKFDTGWVMYSNPAHLSFWYFIPGKLKDGSLVNLKNFKNELHFEKPNIPSSDYKNRNWRRFIGSLIQKRDPDLFKSYSDYLCTKWNSTNTGNKQLEYLSIIMYLKKQLINYNSEGPYPTKIWSYKCK